jgi:hypothetical protein
MKINEVMSHGQGLKLYRATIKMQQSGYKQLISTTVVAKNLTMALKLLKAQYGQKSVLGTPRVIQDYTV